VKSQWKCSMNVTRRLLPVVPVLVLSMLGTPARLTAAEDGRDEAGGGFALSSIDVPGAVRTQAQGINDRGSIVGLYRSSDGVAHGFLLRDGDFTSINYPGAAYTDARGINAQGDMVGTYHLPSENSDLSPFTATCCPETGNSRESTFRAIPTRLPSGSRPPGSLSAASTTTTS
jgi:probable HAF family extracellular repeat protein